MTALRAFDQPWISTRTSFDALVERVRGARLSFEEEELLRDSHWCLGQDARLREDVRFRQTPWGRWMPATAYLANEALFTQLHREPQTRPELEQALADLDSVVKRQCVFCKGDPRFVLEGGAVRLAARELTNQPLLEREVGDLEKYVTHLPVHSLKAAAASLPAGEWGKSAQEQVIETIGWVRVSVGRKLNRRMFVAQIEGKSMDDGRSGLVDGGYAVFELWPSGTKQLLSVLVRGAFSDPETGSYAVKKYVADERDEEGRHHRVTLVSLNPDKERYPDIELQPEDDDDTTVVAKVVQALSLDDYQRRPKAKRRFGRRNLTGREALDEQAARLGRRVSAFFDTTTLLDDDDGEDDLGQTTSTGWRTRVVCLDAGSGGLHLELGPLDGLPPFVKRLRVVGERSWDGFVLAANARTRPTRLPARPASGPWRWEAVGFEGEHDLGLEKLAVEAIETDGPVVFRVDAEGVGQQTTTAVLAIGQAYRLLLPPNVGDSSLGVEIDAGPGGGWRLWAIDLSVPLSPVTLHLLASLGLQVGEAWPRLEWALAPAALWRINVRGQSYPVFTVGTEVFVNVSGMVVDDDDPLVLFLHGATVTEQIPMSTTGLVSLGTPPEGRWACALLHSRTSIQPSTLVFEVAENAVEHIPATWTASAPQGLASLEVTAPPGWPVALRWRVLHEEPLATVYAADDGSVALEGISSLTEARARRTRIADLVLDFGELGRRHIAHDGRASVKQVRDALTTLWQQRSGLVQSRAGAWLQLMPAWFEPVTALLGYGIEPLAEGAVLTTEAESLLGLAAWQLTVDERMVGSITRAPSRVLVLTTDLDAAQRDCREWIDNACSAARVRAAILTDGVRWTTHRKGDRQVSRREWHLDHAIGLGVVDDMLNDLAEGL